MSGTNSPVESHNAVIKRNFTNRLKFHLKSAVEIFTTLIEYESLKPDEFHMTPKVPKQMRDRAIGIIESKQLSTDDDAIYHYSIHVINA